VAEAVTVEGASVESKLKTVAAPSLSSFPRGSPTTAVRPSPESPTEVPNWPELAGGVSATPGNHPGPW